MHICWNRNVHKMYTPIFSFANRRSLAHPRLAWRYQIGPMLDERTLRNTRWLRTVRKYLFRVFNNFPFFRLVSQASSAKGAACEICEWSESRNQCYAAQCAERVDIHACKTLSSGLLDRASFWPKNGLRSNLIASRFKNFSGDMIQTPLPACFCTRH